MKKRMLAAMLCTALLLALTLLPTGCQTYDAPPADNSPEPPALSGTFVCGDSRLVFSGDGRSLEYTFTPELAEAADLPESDGGAEYVFLFQHREYRYDKAESFRITASDGSSCDFMNVHGETNENAVVLFSPAEGAEKLVFAKTAG